MTRNDDEPKERVIHTRVPESLETELRRRAQDLGISVSNLVRNVLGHAFGLVNDVVADSHAIARAVGPRDRASASAAGEAGARAVRGGRKDDVIAWQPITLAKNAVCALCNEVLAKGSKGAIGVTDSGAPGPIVCTPCSKGDE